MLKALSRLNANTNKQDEPEAATETKQNDSAAKKDDKSIAKKEKKKKEKEPVDETERNKRTAFVGNLSVDVLKNPQMDRQFKKLFKKFGSIESVRYRSIAFAELKPKKISYLQKKLHDARDSLNAYVVFKTEADALAAASLNGTVFLEKHLRVDVAGNKAEVSRKKAVFIGNLPFDINDEDVWRHFGEAGQVTNVRLIRDSTTNIGKGFGYVQFQERKMVLPALKLDGSTLAGREIRVTKCQDKDADTLPVLLAAARRSATSKRFKGKGKVISKVTSKMTSKATSKAMSKVTSKATSKAMSKAASKVTSKTTSKMTSKTTSKMTSKTTSKATSKATSKVMSKTHKITKKPAAKSKK